MCFLISFHNKYSLLFLPRWILTNSKLKKQTLLQRSTFLLFLFMNLEEPGEQKHFDTLQEVIYAHLLIEIYKFSSHLPKVPAKSG